MFAGAFINVLTGTLAGALKTALICPNTDAVTGMLLSTRPSVLTGADRRSQVR